jgi:hypothetical protein
LVFAIGYNLVRLAMVLSAHSQGIDVERINFVEASRRFGASETDVPLDRLLINPARPNHVESRVKKRRPKNFLFMVISRPELSKRLKRQAVGS